MQTLFFTLSILAAAFGAQDRARLDGRWTGTVDSDIGQMTIEVSLTVDGDKAKGTIKTAHGEFTIADGTFANGTWTLPFTAPGAKGYMAGAIKGNVFSGKWVNEGTATGTFYVTRKK